MSPWVKRIAAALAIKEGIERVQEMRQPKRSIWSRMTKPLGLLALGGGGWYLYKSGKLDPLMGQAKEMMGDSSNGSSYTSSEWTAPAATSGTTSVGASSTSSTV